MQNNTRQNPVEALFKDEISLYQNALARREHDLCVLHLGRAHILSQKRWDYHLWVHYLMLRYAWGQKDLKEIFGQVLRLLLTIPGHLINRLPKGNIGWSSVHFNKEMPIPNEFKKYFE